jgi:hypothetical protein
MRVTVTSILELLGFVSFVAGLFLTFSVGPALLIGGIVLVVLGVVLA